MVIFFTGDQHLDSYSQTPEASSLGSQSHCLRVTHLLMDHLVQRMARLLESLCVGRRVRGRESSSRKVHFLVQLSTSEGRGRGLPELLFLQVLTRASPSFCSFIATWKLAGQLSARQRRPGLSLPFTCLTSTLSLTTSSVPERKMIERGALWLWPEHEGKHLVLKF